MPLLMSGNTTCQSVRQRDAPRLAAASSTFGGSVCRLIATVRTANGRQITDVADEQRGEADVFAQAGVLEELQQADAGHQRRQHQRPERQRHHRVAPGEAVAREREGERQREQRADERGQDARASG